MLCPRSAASVELATGCAWSWSSSPSPSAGSVPAPRPAPRRWTGAAVLGRPGPLLEPAHGHHPAAPGERLAGVLGLVAPDDHGEERRLLLPPTRDGHPEPGPGDPALGGADVMVVGEGAGEADGRLGHGPAPSWSLAGRSACLGHGGTVDTVACRKSTRGKRQRQRSRPDWIRLPAFGRLGCRVDW
jgi:hypothetical protein